MDSYLLLRFLHILSAIVVMGTGAGIAFFMLMAYRSKNVAAIQVTAKHVVLADWLFTTPAVITQFVTGLLLMERLNYSYSSNWFLLVISLFVFIGLCWPPVLKIQYQIRDRIDQVAQGSDMPKEFQSLMKYWILLGIPAFLAILVIFGLMVFKPFLMI